MTAGDRQDPQDTTREEAELTRERLEQAVSTTACRADRAGPRAWVRGCRNAAPARLEGGHP
ncbi:hypothetical protein GCM10027053_24680 [Intrasporangium mesophilum]